ncbi:M23 family metallopeptidase [Clostridium sediminicola]|uniref:peptidoglycan DD-metalloendopeptidase family protein n=1 Tax=Clostridium sediminicola TaxID=3114879 RepID=UPI0031F1D7FA
MENNNNKKKGNIFKKEGFYIILFVCLCLVATIVAVTTNKKLTADKKGAESEIAEIMDEKRDLIGMDSSDDEFYDNALQVQDGENKGIAEKEDEDEKKEESINTEDAENTASAETASVSNTSNKKFVNPVPGEIVRQYSTAPVFWNTTESNRPNFGMDIKAELGKEVVACLDGTVQKVSLDTIDGVTVVIYHPQSGLRTVYANLDKKVSVKDGDKVQQGDKIGSIGATTVRAAYESYGNKFLHFEVLKGEKELAQYSSVDPLKYVKY